MPFDSIQTAPIANQLRNLLGPNGEHWCKNVFEDSRGRMCLLGALGKLYQWQESEEPKYNRALHLLTQAIQQRRRLVGSAVVVQQFNDADSTDWQQIATVLGRLEQIEVTHGIATVG